MTLIAIVRYEISTLKDEMSSHYWLEVRKQLDIYNLIKTIQTSQNT